jgi:hypothetical protein
MREFGSSWRIYHSARHLATPQFAVRPRKTDEQIRGELGNRQAARALPVSCCARPPMILIHSVAAIGPAAVFIASAGLASLLVALDEARFRERAGPR